MDAVEEMIKKQSELEKMLMRQADKFKGLERETKVEKVERERIEKQERQIQMEREAKIREEQKKLEEIRRKEEEVDSLHSFHSCTYYQMMFSLKRRKGKKKKDSKQRK